MRVLNTLLAVAAATFPAVSQAQEVQTVPGFADFLAVDGQTVWTTNRGKVEQWSRKGKLAEVVLAHPCGAMAVFAGSLWVANCEDGTLNRIDTRTAKLVATIPTGIANQKEGELNVVAGAGSVWLASDAAGKLARVDPASNSVAATISVDPMTSYLAFGYGAVWAVSLPQQSLQKVDPATNSVTGKVALGKAPGFLAAGEGGVWVQEQGDGTLARIDPATVALTGRIKVGENLKWGDIDTGAGKVWLRTTDDQEFAVIDPKTMTVTARMGKPAGSGALRFTKKGVWTTAHDVHTLTWWPKAILKGR
ncbi:Vgb family protein [Novosphingobium cyanobacteriorum]|uniref:YncE family protein n=1 Tax=Novosphingobium cyanobacteriorum TaxID=3024215 RepID=A0ABT6CCS3_9SPHN|nr:YncE family protein [Novosphingobium cyanobacteriorum]MDF8331736.1 YncE family protein [Novosphingobium cyanobacteriorum]